LAQIELMNHCAARSILSAGAGAVLGVFFGVFMGTMEPAHVPMDGEPAKPWREVLKETARNTRAKSWTYFKGFGAMGLMFSGSECLIEKVRGESARSHMILNSDQRGVLVLECCIGEKK
jgi:mitochondrial import inner membrane translocase subunit TIM22